MSVVPRSLCAVDGSLYIPTDKASLMHVIEAAKTEPRVPDLPETTAVDYRDRALVVDAMAELQSMKKTPTMRTLADLKETFVERIENMLNGFHEEADTLIPNQVLASAAKQSCREICVSSPDTDVYILLIDPVSLAPQTRLKILIGKGRTYREIDIIERVCVIGARKWQGFVGLHNFSGADSGGKFVGISKKTWVDVYMSLDEDDPAIDCFRNLGLLVIPTQVDNGELPPQLQSLEHFVWRVYCMSGSTKLPSLRWKMFRTRNLEGESLPPTCATLLPHITRANYIAMRDKSYTTNYPVLPPIDKSGWLVKGTLYNEDDE